MLRVPWGFRHAIVVVAVVLSHCAAEVLGVAAADAEIRSFVGREGQHFVVEGQPFYVNGWNSYWLMTQAVEENTRSRVVSTFLHGAALGMTVCRTWAFNDAAYDALQTSPGAYSEKTFQVAHDHPIPSFLTFLPPQSFMSK